MCHLEMAFYSCLNVKMICRPTQNSKDFNINSKYGPSLGRLLHLQSIFCFLLGQCWSSLDGFSKSSSHNVKQTELNSKLTMI